MYGVVVVAGSDGSICVDVGVVAGCCVVGACVVVVTNVPVVYGGYCIEFVVAVVGVVLGVEVVVNWCDIGVSGVVVGDGVVVGVVCCVCIVGDIDVVGVSCVSCCVVGVVVVVVVVRVCVVYGVAGGCVIGGVDVEGVGCVVAGCYGGGVAVVGGYIW